MSTGKGCVILTHMPVKIRLMRIGATKRPFYRVVAVDERKKRTGGYLDLLGTYNPLTEPKEIILKQDKIDEWIKKGAVLSDGYLRMTKQAPQRPPRKPKKLARNASQSDAGREKKEEAKKEITQEPEAPTEATTKPEVKTEKSQEEVPVEETTTETPVKTETEKIDPEIKKVEEEEEKK